MIPRIPLSVVLAAERNVTVQARFKYGPGSRLNIVSVSHSISLTIEQFGTQFYAPKTLCSAREK